MYFDIFDTLINLLSRQFITILMSQVLPMKTCFICPHCQLIVIDYLFCKTFPNRSDRVLAVSLITRPLKYYHWLPCTFSFTAFLSLLLFIHLILFPLKALQLLIYLIQQLLFCWQVKFILTGKNLFLSFGQREPYNSIILTGAKQNADGRVFLW